jgi:hypothetical protein
MRIRNAPGATSAISIVPILLIKRRGEFLLADSQFSAFFSCSSDIMEAPSPALCAFQNIVGAALFYHVGA